VQIEMKRLAGLNRLAIEMTGAKDEGARPVGEAAGSVALRHGFEHTGTRARLANVAGTGLRTPRHTGDAAEYHSECAAQYVGGVTGGKIKRVPRDEPEAQRVKFKAHLPRNKSARPGSGMNAAGP
jgi:hypothetical protein